MPTTGAAIGKGVILSYCATKAGTYIPVGKLKTLKPPKVKSGKAESTGFNDPSEQFIPAFLNGGECGFGVVYQQPGTQTATLYALLQVVQYWKILYVDGGFWNWSGFLDEYEAGVPLKETMGDMLNIVLSGFPGDAASAVPTYTVGT